MNARRSPFPAVLSLILATGAGGPVLAAGAADEPWLDRPFAAAPAEVLAAAELGWTHGIPTAQRQNLLVEDLYRFDASGRRTITRRRVFRVLTAAGVSGAGTVEAYWKPWREEPPRLLARVIRKDATEHALDPATASDKPVSSAEDVFDDRRIRQAPLPGLEPGAVVETSVVLTETQPLLGGSRSYSSLGWTQPARRYRVIVEAPAALPLSFKVLGREPLAPVVEKRGELVVRTWDVPEPAPVPELDPGPLPPEVTTPLLEIATGRSWSDVATAYSRLVDERISRGATAALPAGLPSAPLPRMQALLSDLQRDVRYTSLAFGESDITPAPPDEVRRRRYGDCKDQATLLVSLLRKAGLEADVALLSTGPGRDISPDLPALGDFDHAIVHVTKPETWIDPTSVYSRAGELPSPDRDRWALVCRKGVTSVVKTPRATAADSVERLELTLRMADEGRCDVTEATTYGGAVEARLRRAWDGADAKRFREQMESYAQGSLGKATLVKAEHGEARDLGKPFALVLDATGSNLAVTGEVASDIRIWRGFGLASLPKTSDKKRRTDLAVPPLTRETVVRIVPPAGFRVVETPVPETRTLGPAAFSIAAAPDDKGGATVTMRLVLDRDRLTPDEVSALHTAVEELGQEGPLVVRVVHDSELALADGRVADAFRSLRAELEASPGTAPPHRRLSRALLAVGLGDAARRQAREAVRLAPSSPAAHRALARALSHDPFGRPYRTGWDPDGAGRAFAEAERLEPGDVATLVDQAEALEYDAHGNRYADPKRLASALSVYETLLKKNAGNTPLARAYALALLFAGRPADALTFVGARPDASTLADLSVVAIAVRDGAAKAREEGRRRIPAGDRSGALEKAAGTLVSLRRYPEAAELLREAARGSEKAAALGARADLCARLSRAAPSDDGKDPVALFRAFNHRLLGTTKPAPADLEPLVARPFRPALPELIPALRSLFVTQGFESREVARDVGTYSPEWVTDGTAETGIRMRVLGADQTGADAWVVKEDGRLRLLSIAIADPLARYAEGLLARGDRAGARTWLERAREMESEASEKTVVVDRPPTRWFDLQDPAGPELLLAALASQNPTYLAKASVAALERLAAERPDDVRTGLLLGLATFGAKDDARALALARRLHERAPESERVASLLLEALRANRLVPEAVATARAHLEKNRSHLDVRRQLVTLLAETEDFAGAAREAEEILAAPRSTALDLNNAAWFRMLTGRSDEQTLSMAQRAVDTSGRRDEGLLNTLGAIYAEAGRAAEARALILESMEVSERDEPEASDWYVVGRLLEGFGLTADAIDAYRKAREPGPARPGPGRDQDAAERPGGTSWLSARRLAALEKESAAAGKAAPKPGT